jgi:hypothetical protein
MKRIFNISTVSMMAVAISLVAATTWGISTTRQQFEQSVRHDLSAASLLARMQIEGERVRRFEKEAFIYIANPTKRRDYAKEHAEAYGRLLEDLDEALMSRNRAFSDEERKTVTEWKQAAVFYDGQFSDLIRRAEWLDGQGLGAADAGRMTVEYNAAIAEGKNRFRVLLQGAGDLRKVKEQSSQKGADVISRTLSLLGWLAIGLSTSGCLLLPLLAARNHLAGRRSTDESKEAPVRALARSNVAIRVA